jgi:hypothetical protein
MRGKRMWFESARTELATELDRSINTRQVLNPFNRWRPIEVRLPGAGNSEAAIAV